MSSDLSDPEFDELEPMQRPRKERLMAAVKETEAKEYAVTGPLVVKGESYEAGDKVSLTAEEHAALVAVGASVEGVEPKDADAVQAAHEAGVAAQKAEIERRAKEEETEV